jgi:hypothetical protein
VILHEIKVHPEPYPSYVYTPHYHNRGYQTPVVQQQRPSTQIVPFRQPANNIGTNYESELNKPKVREEKGTHFITPNTPKMVYQEWLKGTALIYKVGDYVVSRKKAFPYDQKDYLRVCGLQEMHTLLTFDEEGEPMVLDLVTADGTRFMSASSRWRVIHSPIPTAFQFDLPAY